MPEKGLPDLPGSDPDTLKRDRTDPFYEKRPSDIWGGYIENITLEEPKRCKHYFVETKTGVMCRECHLGWDGKDLTVKNGHVFAGNQKLI